MGGLLWTLLGLLFLLRNLGIGPDLWHLIGRYWPILLILLGLGKVIDYYRQREGVSLRFGEVFGLLFLLIVGSAISRVSESPMSDLIWRTPIRIGGSDISLGSSYSYSEEASFPISPETLLVIENSYGAVTVSAGSDREVRARLRKVVFSSEEAKAKEVAGQIKIEGNPEGSAEASTLVIRTNREDLAAREYQFETNMEIFVPRKVQLKIQNSYGEVTVTGLEGKLEASTSQKALEVREFSGDVAASNRYGEVRLSDITGNVQVDARGRVEIEGVRGQVGVRNEYSAISVSKSDGPVTVSNTEGSITVEDIAKRVTIDARGSQVTARNLSEGIKVATSHRRVRIEAVEAGVDLDTRYANVTLDGVKGDTSITSNSDRLTLENLAGKLVIRAKGSSVRSNGTKGAVDIQTTLKDVIVNDFESGCAISNEYADVRLATATLAAGAVNVRNSNGDIDLYLPRDAAFQIDAAVRAGEDASDLSGLRAEPGSGDVSILKGSLKSGGPAITLQTEYGKIRLRIYDEDRERRPSN